MPQSIEAALGYRFRNSSLLRQALTHRSFGVPHNERLEFLGDSVLNCVIARALFHQFPDLSEGDLSRLRAHLVKEHSLTGLARDLALGEALVLGEGEARNGGRTRPSILADTLEALFGAMLLDQGFDAAASVILDLYRQRLADIDPETLGKDPKTLLQEYVQARRIPLPVYHVVATTGEAHRQHFDVECRIESLGVCAAGSGSSRRNAEQVAARSAYEMLARRNAQDTPHG